MQSIHAFLFVSSLDRFSSFVIKKHFMCGLNACILSKMVITRSLRALSTIRTSHLVQRIPPVVQVAQVQGPKTAPKARAVLTAGLPYAERFEACVLAQKRKKLKNLGYRNKSWLKRLILLAQKETPHTRFKCLLFSFVQHRFLAPLLKDLLSKSLRVKPAASGFLGVPRSTGEVLGHSWSSRG